jgi:DNA-binding beta-propeller fold protein YncE
VSGRARSVLPAILLALVSSASRAEEEKDPKIWLRPVALFDKHLYEGSFAEPRGIFFDPAAQEVWVADTRNGRVGVFTPDGVPLFSFGATDRLREPVRLAVAKSGDVYVLGIDRSRIERFSYRGEYLGALQLPGVPAKPVFGTLTVDADGNLWVGENETGQVLAFSPDLKPLLRFGSSGDGEGQFQAFAGIAVARDVVVVTDHQVLAVQIFDRRGNYVRGWGKHDMGAANFSLPEGVALDGKGRIVVVDALRHEIKLFDLEGNFLDRFGGLGTKAGNVSYPSDVAVDAGGHVFVAERGNSRVQVFVETAEPPLDARPPTKADRKETSPPERTKVSPESPNDSKR